MLSLDSHQFHIKPLDRDRDLRDFYRRVNQKLEPSGALGFLGPVLEKMSLQQGGAVPKISEPSLLMFAADHGNPPVRKESIASAVISILNGNAALYHYWPEEIRFQIIDVGVDHAFEGNFSYWLHHGNKLINARVNQGTEEFSEFPALTTAQALEAFDIGVRLVRREYYRECNFLALAGMGQATMSNIALAAVLSDSKAEKWVENEVRNQSTVRELNRAITRHPKTKDVFTVLTIYGGIETVALCGAILQAAELGICSLIDNQTAAVATLAASKINEHIADYVLWADTGGDLLSRKIREQTNGVAVLNQSWQQAPGHNSAMALRTLMPFLAHLSAEDPGTDILF